MATKRKKREKPEDLIQPIPDTFENVIKSLVRPMKPKTAQDKD